MKTKREQKIRAAGVAEALRALLTPSGFFCRGLSRKERAAFLRDVANAFDRAEEWCGCLHPDDIDHEMQRTRETKKLALRLLRIATKVK